MEGETSSTCLPNDKKKRYTIKKFPTTSTLQTPKPRTSFINKIPFSTIKKSNLSSNASNSMGTIDESCEENVDEKIWQSYNIYLTRKLQNVIFKKDIIEKEKKAKEFLVESKLEYKALLTENFELKKEIMKLEALQHNLLTVLENKSHYKRIVEVLHDKDWTQFQTNLKLSLQVGNDCMQLSDISRKELDDALRNNVLGLDSLLMKSLKQLHDIVKDHVIVDDEMRKDLEAVQILLDGRKELLKRCQDKVDFVAEQTVDLLYQSASQSLAANKIIE